MIDLSVFDNAKRLAGALERRFDGIDLQRLASVLNYVPEQLQVDILALCTIIADSFTSTVVTEKVKCAICEDLCRHSRDCRDQDELDEMCEQCPLCEVLG